LFTLENFLVKNKKKMVYFLGDCIVSYTVEIDIIVEWRIKEVGMSKCEISF
jgi:hypothetical protein